ncbi:MAG: hypothetical protein QM754_05575 [Tepidisphaeraceae bacterium]
MSSVSGVSGNSGWLQMLKSQATQSTSSTSDASSTGRAKRGGDRGERLTTALQDQGITGDKLTDLRSKIDSAVETAKSNGTDPKEAIDGVLTDAGVDMDAFRAEMAPPDGGQGGPDGAKGPPPGGKPPAGAVDGTSATSSTDDEDDDDDSVSTVSSSLETMLTNAGISVSDFKSSLYKMLQSGSTDTSSLFSGAAVGSSLDIAA